jgi:hypothetical protein
MGLPCFTLVGAGTGAFLLPGFGVHSCWRPGPWGLAMRPREADMAPGAARGGGAYRYPACGGKCRGSGPRRRPRPPARFWSCSKRVPALPGTELLRRRSAHPAADPTEGQRDRRLCWRPVRLSPVSAPSPCSICSNDICPAQRATTSPPWPWSSSLATTSGWPLHPAGCRRSGAAPRRWPDSASTRPPGAPPSSPSPSNPVAWLRRSPASLGP